MLPGYKCYFCAAKKSSKGGRNLGGVVVFVRNSLVKFTKHINTAFRFGIMLIVDKGILKVDKDLFYACVYLPPFNSPFYADESGIDCLENEIIKNMEDFNRCDTLICGDFNARTAGLDDFVTLEKDIPNLLEYKSFFCDGITTPRTSSDKMVNKFGKQLIELCKSYNISILNGRFGSDSGDFTFIDAVGCSVVDYFIASSKIFEIVTSLNIENRPDCKHLPVAVNIEAGYTNDRDITNETETADLLINDYRFADRDDENIFKSNLANKIINGDFESFIDDVDDGDTNIDDVVKKLELLILDCCIVHKKRIRCNRYRKKSSNKWFDEECRNLKLKRNQSLRKFRHTKSVSDLNSYIYDKFVFRNHCRIKQEQHRRTELDQISASIGNSKAFWKNIKSVSNKPKTIPDITIQEWYIHFRNVFGDVDVDFDNINDDNDGSVSNDVNCNNNNAILNVNDHTSLNECENILLNGDITDDEIKSVIGDLKRNKSSSGYLRAEHLLASTDMLIPFLQKLFNRIFKSGMFPEQWSYSLLIPIHKKGPVNNPDNYRGIALLDVISKLYVNVLNKRLTFYSNAYDKISEAQAGFRSGYSTTDNVFILYSLISKYLCRKRRKLYVAFVDFRKAFDSVQRSKLFKVLQNKEIKGCLLDSIKSIYSSVKARIRCGYAISEELHCSVGLRQGCNLSPILFSLFINELHDVITSSGITGIQLYPDLAEILILLFADDVALIADTPQNLQKQLNILSNYCSTWKLSVNVEKTKIVVFKNGGQLARNEIWFYNGDRIETVNGFTYVGTYFSPQLSMYKMANELAIKAKRVLINLLSSLHHLSPMPKSIFFKLFDTKIAPILLYGAEIWGLLPMNSIETVHMYACKRFMCVPNRSSNVAVAGECERFPMYIQAAKRCIKYWLKILSMPERRYVRKSYEMLRYFDNIGYSNWVSRVRTHLCSIGFGYIWENQYVLNEKLFLNQYSQRLKDQYLQQWHASCDMSSKLQSYIGFKPDFKFEVYLDVVEIKKFRNSLASFRISCHPLMIEKGRHLDIERESRFCNHCRNHIEDEYHFLLICPLYSNLRRQYIQTKYLMHPNVNKFNNLMSCRNTYVIRNLAMYVYHAFELRKTSISTIIE